MTTTILQTVPAGAYTLDPVHSSLGFAVKHNGISMFRGQFERVDAALEDGVLTGTAQVDSVLALQPIRDRADHSAERADQRRRAAFGDRDLEAKLPAAAYLIQANSGEGSDEGETGHEWEKQRQSIAGEEYADDWVNHA